MSFALSKRLSLAPLFFILLLGSTATANELEERLQLLEHQRLEQALELDFLDYIAGCVISRVHVPFIDPDTGKTEYMPAIYTFPNVNRKVPAVLIVPTIHEFNPLEQKISDQLCDLRYASIFPDFQMNTLEKPEMLLKAFDHSSRRMILKMRTLIDVLSLQPEVDKDRIGLYGLSLGGILGSMISLIDERVKASVLAAAGEDFPAIIARSQDKVIRKIRTNQMRRLGLTMNSEYEKRLKESIKLDNAFFVKHLKAKPTFMVIVTNDLHVPTVYQNRLWESLERPSYMNMDSGHVWSLLKLIGGNKKQPLQFLYNNL